ncbi:MULTISPECIES: hypothetical protein [Flavobacterium]|uniref:Uncharacterized protein n=1 Tax=Flavobacterium columnare TaxID=996 RepID=A0A437U982_9FLAO|nr:MULTISPECIES: hypothetical protein [Flavobacterium]QYS88923.1 hypothetical protein JJC05_16185 [Flavobacterium davisii]QYS88934.1 hypothetical protein JJC05_00065 [Flavobacterium davisii]RVU90131.1 hypothetical protein EH230_04050 [Flavobacterium columnare]
MNNLSNWLTNRGISTWEELTKYVQKIPYGRNSLRNDFSLVLTEHRGSCSSKHALLKSLASDFNQENTELILGIFKMNAKNTPSLKEILESNSIDYIPEAHCYLKINDQYKDYTSKNSLYSRIKEDILFEIIINPDQVIQYKIDYHQTFLKNWIFETKQNKTFEEIWDIREKCIAQLSK